jgi:predicted MFS family arabinose efflux permease
MAVLGRLFRLIWGGDVDRALRPVLATGFAGAIAFSAGWSFMGIWAIKELEAGSGRLGAAYLVGAGLAGVSGYAGGHLSDHVGRRPLILIGWGGSALYFLLFLTAGHTVYLGLGLMAGAGVLGAFGGSSTQAMVADLVHPERREAAYASVRVAQNLGVVCGPPIGSLFLLLGGWHALFLGVSSLSASGFLLAYRYLPRTGAYAPDGPPERGSFGAIRRDRVFLLFLGSGVLAQLTYVAFEIVLPVSLVDSHGLKASTWGFLVILNPAMVTFFQLRLTRRVRGISPAVKLSSAMLLMGLPFLLLSASSAIPVVLVVIFVFVIGEMLWVPTSQSVIAALAPADIRGAYMGAFGSTGAVGFALAPFLGLQVRAGFGDSAMWGMFAAISVVGAVAGVAACRGVRVRTRDEDLGGEPAAA